VKALNTRAASKRTMGLSQKLDDTRVNKSNVLQHLLNKG
jgi:hypothetical protein